MTTQTKIHAVTEPVDNGRIVALAGVGFVAFRVLAAFLPAPHPSEGLSEFIAEAVDDAGVLSLSAWLGLLSAFAFAVFAAGMAGRLFRSGRANEAFLALTGAAVASGASTVGYSARWVLARRAGKDGTLTDAYVLSLYDLGSVTNYLAPVGFALVAVAVGAAAFSSARPRSSWYAWPTIALAATLMIPFGDTAFFALWLFFAWVLLISTTATRDRGLFAVLSQRFLEGSSVII